jgi:hypothetical protein
LRSAPAQKARPVPVMIPTFSVGSASSHDQILSSSAWPSWLMQLRSLGLFNRTSKTPGAGYERTTYWPEGSGSSKLGLDIMAKLSMTFWAVEVLKEMGSCLCCLYEIVVVVSSAISVVALPSRGQSRGPEAEAHEKITDNITRRTMTSSINNMLYHFHVIIAEMALNSI